MARVAIYLRVSTDQQTTDNQRLELTAWASRCGHQVVDTYEDHGVSGAKASGKRPALSKLLKDATRRRFDLVAVWSIDRLGRSLQDLTATLASLHDLKIELFIHQQAIDTTTPAGKALFGMCGVFAEFEREIIRERIYAGIARAKKKGTKSGKAIGRPTADPKRLDAARDALVAGKSVRETASVASISVGKVAELRKAMVASGAIQVAA
jgi:DNA invertase Pin-like site-specific DNA recombinase